MFGSPENNNTELRSDSTSGDVSEVESGLEVTESEMDDDLAKALDEKYNKEVEEEPSKEKLPTCFDGLSEESKTKQYEALDKMSDEERKAYFDIIEEEPAITADVQDVANKNGGELQGLEYRVKTPSSIYEKMHEREEGTDIGEMKDVIRYTEIYPPDKLAEGTNASLRDFESRGYTVDKVKNTWDDENTAYRGINANLTSPDGQKFEVQFHTQESFDLKNGELHLLYEQRRTMADDDPRAADLDDRMSELSSQLERPDSIDEVKNR